MAWEFKGIREPPREQSIGASHFQKSRWPSALLETKAQTTMRFSLRTGWNTEESDLARAYRVRREAGLPIADLTASNPTRCGFSYPADLLAPLTLPAALDYDPQPRGSLFARESVAGYYAGHGASVDPLQVILTTSTSEAYSFLFRLLCDPGAEILVPHPGYPLFDFLAALDDVRLVPFPLVFDHGWQIDPEALRRAITPRTRAIVVIHPNNPTGHFTKLWEAAELARFCREFDLSLIVDEVFLDYPLEGKEASAAGAEAQLSHCDTYGPAEAVPLLQNGRRLSSSAASSAALAPVPTFAAGLDGVPAFVVSGLSKIAGLPQMKAAWIVATGSDGPENVQALDRLEVIADTFLSMNAPVQCALPAWLDSRSPLQQQIRARVAANLATLDRALLQLPAVQRLPVEGGWYAILRIPALQPDEQTVLDLLDRGLWLHPGYFFGLPASGWLVLSLLAPEPEFTRGAVLLVDALRAQPESSS
jgi:aspartate/methionine/tyrosine aminotransferase